MGYSVFRPLPPPLLLNERRRFVTVRLRKSHWLVRCQTLGRGCCPRMLPRLRRARQCNAFHSSLSFGPLSHAGKRVVLGNYWIRARNLRGTHPSPTLDRTIGPWRSPPLLLRTMPSSNSSFNDLFPNDLGGLVSGHVPSYCDEIDISRNLTSVCTCGCTPKARSWPAAMVSCVPSGCALTKPCLGDVRSPHHR
jgi:hypothetical protein